MMMMMMGCYSYYYYVLCIIIVWHANNDRYMHACMLPQLKI